ncbi:ABC transporter permease, partial [Nonomuraea sp. NPDC049141]
MTDSIPMTPERALAPRRPHANPPGRRRAKRVNAHRRREARTAYVFLAPWFVGLFVITVGPILASLYLSFT